MAPLQGPRVRRPVCLSRSGRTRGSAPLPQGAQLQGTGSCGDIQLLCGPGWPSVPRRHAWKDRRGEARHAAQAASRATPRPSPALLNERQNPDPAAAEQDKTPGGALQCGGSLQAFPPRAVRHFSGSRQRSASGHVLALRHHGHAWGLILIIVLHDVHG
ncbi:hypothetical protein NDU88_009248 [Pleurodeles waltl]|uniref:Uncharacterized protein n=1 Tax=Pleurodeles waltl TaxID=8319 RepID=A0AAV7QR24_PLEWA|nr:hypothetical protein NDU88_009248 [Pleurodeles waltl]